MRIFVLRGNRASGRYLVGLCLVVGLPVAIGLLGWRRGEPAPLSEPIPTPTPVGYQFPSVELAALDRVVQERFADLRDTNFGFTRIGIEHRNFVPRTHPELEAVKKLGQANTQVIFYVLRDESHQKKGSPPSYSTLRGPLYMEGGRAHDMYQFMGMERQPFPKDAPDTKKLLDAAWKVCVEKPAAKGLNIQDGRWTESAVPIVASKPGCLRCHDTAGKGDSRFERLPIRKVKLGDTLGVAIYCSAKVEGPESSPVSEETGQLSASDLVANARQVQPQGTVLGASK